MTCSPPEKYRFDAIEQLDDFHRELNWAAQYQQLQPGSYFSSITVLEGGSWFIFEEQSSLSLEAEAASPVNMYVFAIVERSMAVVNGETLSAQDVFFQAPNSDFRCVLPAGVSAIQLAIDADQFEEIFHAVQNDTVMPRGVLNLRASDPGNLALALNGMKSALHAPSARIEDREESISRMVTELIATAFNEGSDPRQHTLHSAKAQRVLSRARDYIEGHLAEAIRIPEVCKYAGTTARSLERTFARELGATPQQYIKARRLNAARRSLISAQGSGNATVTETAQGLGFTHMGRFAQDYRLYFGETPRATLRTE